MPSFAPTLSLPRLVVAALAAFTMPTFALKNSTLSRLDANETKELLSTFRDILPMIRSVASCETIQQEASSITAIYNGLVNNCSDFEAVLNVHYKATYESLRDEINFCDMLLAMPEVQEALEVIKSAWGGQDGVVGGDAVGVNM